jgi:hypothetical protein
MKEASVNPVSLSPEYILTHYVVGVYKHGVIDSLSLAGNLGQDDLNSLKR